MLGLPSIKQLRANHSHLYYQQITQTAQSDDGPCCGSRSPSWQELTLRHGTKNLKRRRYQFHSQRGPKSNQKQRETSGTRVLHNFPTEVQHVMVGYFSINYGIAHHYVLFVFCKTCHKKPRGTVKAHCFTTEVRWMNTVREMIGATTTVGVGIPLRVVRTRTSRCEIKTWMRWREAGQK